MLHFLDLPLAVILLPLSFVGFDLWRNNRRKNAIKNAETIEIGMTMSRM